MRKYFLAFPVFLFSFTGYAQQTLYNFLFQFASVKENNEFIFNKEGMKNEAYKEIFKNTSILGKMYKNGTLFSFNTNENPKDTVDMDMEKAIIDLKLINDNGHSYGFLTKEIAIEFNEKDTTYYNIDTSNSFFLTGKKKVITKWNCVEYKPNKEIYQCYSLWVCDKVPQSINLFQFEGIKGGVVELDNYNTNMKIYLVSYKENNINTDYHILMKPTKKSIDILANFNK